MARPKIRTIRASTHPLGTGDFTTIQAWEDYADDKINPYQWAECYQGFDLGTFTLSGWSSTPTSSGYPRIYAASGEQHVGDISKGPVIAPATSSSDVNTISVNYTRIDGIGSTRAFNLNIDAASNIIVENCWAIAKNDAAFEAKSSVGTTSSSGNVIRNCLALGTSDGNDIGFELGGDNMLGGKPGIECYNCTSYGQLNTGFRVTNTKLPGFYGGADVSLKNCISMKCGGIDFSYANTGGNGTITTNNNLSSDNSADDMSVTQDIVFAGHMNSIGENFVFRDPRPGAAKIVSVAGSGVEIYPSGDFSLRKSSVAKNQGTTISSITRDFRGSKRPYGANYDIGAYEYAALTNKIPLFLQGPLPASSGVNLFIACSRPATSEIDLMVRCQPEESGFSQFFTLGHVNPTNTASLYITRGIPSSGIGTLYTLGKGHPTSSGAPLQMNGHIPSNIPAELFIYAGIPSSGVVALNIGNFTFKRREPMFVRGPTAREAQGIGGLGSLFGGLDIKGGEGGGGSEEQMLSVNPSGLVHDTNLFIQAQINISNLKIARGVSGGQFALDATPSASGERNTHAFTLDTELAGTNFIGLNTQGFSGVTAPNSWLFYRDVNINSDKYVPDRRTAFMFSASERNCIDGSLYKFDNNVNDNSSDYGFKLYASGWHQNVAGVGQILESGFFQKSTRFPGSSLTGSGTARFIGSNTAGIKMVSNTTYHGTVLMQSGSPSYSDQHRITPISGHVDSAGNFTPPRRGVATSFWINKKKGLKVNPGLKAIQGVMGNLQIANVNKAASGQWSILYTPSVVKPSGNTPFNSLKSNFKTNSEGKLKVDTKGLGGLTFLVNTTAGGEMGRLLKTDSDGNLVQEHVPDTMMPLSEDRWYYIQFWIDTHLNTSFVRVASPPKGHPGESGYGPEIKPITDKCQKWDGYHVKTDADNLKFKVGGDLFRDQTLPYFNLGYGFAGQEEFIIDELKVSNKVCSPTAMEEQFDTDYKYYTNQFLKDKDVSLFIPGSQIAINASGV